ncbi:unnamed protein product [Phytophthora lilii]|uniref:Unnamed protein product n=1 Tax=Phytophthora lilii TaxID=2077276 RepID=A0A9W7CQA4_9STRA|nr:unnamed protein product [Phytophthora lilii]
MFGKLLSFLHKDPDIHWQTSMNYLSSNKRQLEETTGADLFRSDPEWYRRCRRHLQKQYLMVAISTGRKLKEQAPPMSMEDLRTISTILFLRNDKKALLDRTLLNKQWLSIGRSSDVGIITFSDLHWNGNFFLIDLTRYVRVVSCASHSARRGGAAYASSNPSVNLSDLAHRGLWSMDGFATPLEYTSPTSASDQNVAKVLGGWTDTKQAGHPPTLFCFEKESHQTSTRVTEFAQNLRLLHFAKVSPKGFSDCLAATLSCITVIR